MIALGMALKGPVDPSVLVQWLRVLRDRPWPGPVYDHRDVYPAQARNEITRQFLNGPANTLFMFDSDQLPPLLCEDRGQIRPMPDILEEIKEPIVCGLVYRRDPPYEPVVYEFVKGKRQYVTPGRIAQLIAVRGLSEIDSYGSGTMLIHRRVFDGIQRVRGGPIWQHDPNFDHDEGWKFCAEVRALGYRIWLDTRIEAAHLATRPITTKEYMLAHGFQLAD